MSNKSRNTELALAALCALTLALGGCHHSDAYANNAKASSGNTATERVTAAKPARKTLRLETTQPAWIEPFEESPLFARVAGYVDKVHVDIGDPVKKDQSLVTLSVPELRDDVAQKEASVGQAEAEVKQANANVEAFKAAAQSASARIAEAQADIGRSGGEYQRSTSEYERMKKLAGSGSVSERLVDEAQNQRQSAEAGRDAAQAGVQSAQAVAKEAQAKVTKAEADRVAAEAHLKLARADLARAKTMYEYGEIKSPFDGVVTERLINRGHFVQPATGNSAKPLLVVANQKTVRVFMDVPELEAGFVDVGDQVTLRIQALPGKDLHAAVTRTSWTLNNENRSLRTEVDLTNEQLKLRPGMYASATILLEQRENVLALPVTAIVRDGSQAFCWCVESGKTVRHNVELGLRSGPEVELLSGIDDKCTVAMARAETLHDNQPVEIIPPKEDAKR
jgi:RND family efflux transporter MFP subunit